MAPLTTEDTVTVPCTVTHSSTPTHVPDTTEIVKTVTQATHVVTNMTMIQVYQMHLTSASPNQVTKQHMYGILVLQN